MKLYFSKGACSLAVRIVIHEIGLNAKFESVDLKAKTTETGEDFLRINPKGAVPTLVTDTNEILTENSVIQQYLADVSDAKALLPPIGDFERYRVLEWLNFITTELHKGCAPLFNPVLPQDMKETFIKPLLKTKLDFVEKQLAGHDYLLGSEFMLPDSYLFVILTWLPHFKIDINQWSHMAAYYAKLKTRPSVDKSLREEGL